MLTHVTTRARGEWVDGLEYVAASESVVDTLAALEHPQGILGHLNFDCMAKKRLTRLPQTPETSSVYVQMIYEIKDCTAAN
jgi:hypothetical protein